MLTLIEVRRQVRALIESAANWPDAVLDRYIADAIRFYSAQFPRRWRHTLELTTGTQAYALPGGHGLVRVLSVAYPDSEAYLAEVGVSSSALINGGDVFAVRGIADDTEDDEDTAAGEIVFGPTVATGETAVIEYLGAHVAPAVGDRDAVITVPEAHIEAIVSFVDFRAHVKAEVDELDAVTNSTIALAQIGQEARIAWARYKDVMDRLGWLAPVGSGSTMREMPAWGEYGL